VVEANDVYAALADAREALFTGRRKLDAIATPLQRLLHEPCEAWIVVDIEDMRHPLGHQSASGTCMTAKNRPSWRIALAKPS
jgi:hypothetical protein